ncbi:hypothetical protein ElyMa_005869600 [Elysia marginata]|uniref:Uncharacterized protein n=1 Tax=Elysia marginata TaxID=1093978 RepID=A0AAV4G222_9GAST|nr:hypothetical protein ElyMa_005869600 [Elysia marginata]
MMAVFSIVNLLWILEEARAYGPGVPGCQSQSWLLSFSYIFAWCRVNSLFFISPAKVVDRVVALGARTGRYGPDCNKTCSAQCAGHGNPCHHVDGSCYLGCVQDDHSHSCEPNQALSSKSGVDSVWNHAGVVIGTVDAVAGVIIGVLSWKLHTASRKHLEAPNSEKSNGNIDLVRQSENSAQSGQDPPDEEPENLESPTPNQNYDTAISDSSNDVHAYNIGFDVYENPNYAMRNSGTYLIPIDPTNTADPSATDSDEKEMENSTANTAETAPYGNMASVMSL